MTAANIEIVGADANNLKNVSVSVPSPGVTMVVGVSGSGKSSLLSGTLASEGERRVAAFLRIPRTRQHTRDVAAFVGPMSPTVHVAQRSFRASTRTTIATSSGLLDALRRLFLEASVPRSDLLEKEVPPPSPDTYATWLVRHHRGKITIWAVPVRNQVTDGTRAIERLARSGVEEVVIWGPPRGDKDPVGRKVRTKGFRPIVSSEPHTIEAALASLSISEGMKATSDLQSELQRAFDAGNGGVVVELHGATHPDVQSDFGPRLDSTTDWVIAGDPRVYVRATRPQLSFNAPNQARSGACPMCLGTGRGTTLRLDRLVVRPQKSIHGGAFSLWTDKNYRYVNIQHETIEGLRGLSGFNPDAPWNRLSESAQELILGGASEMIADRERGSGRKMSTAHRYVGFRNAILERVAKGGAAGARLAELVDDGSCPECHGTRWSHRARALRVAGFGIDTLLRLPFSELASLSEPSGRLAKKLPQAVRPLVQDLHQRATAFVSVGLGHLTGDRGMIDVSEGESRRTRLASVLDTTEHGLCLLLDEPARGLHDADLEPMARALRDLGERHTVILNEHRRGLAAAADHLIEMGPGAGSAGGEVTYAGSMSASVWSTPKPLTRAQLSVTRGTSRLTVEGATLHNLKDATVVIPLGRLVCLTGVSGSGKSNFARGVLVPSIARSLGLTITRDDFDVRSGSWRTLKGEKSIKGLVALDHKPPPSNRRSTVLTFTGLADSVRGAFATSPGARAARLDASDFGLNAGQGRCMSCIGLGETDEDEIWEACATCGGSGYSAAVLGPKVDGLNIRDCLDLPVTELRERAAWVDGNRPLLAAMCDLGIGHIALGRRIDSMSGGEVQRLRIAQRLATDARGGVLFVFDEPAAGLHHEDARKLLAALDRIVDKGRNTIVLVEHNISIIRAADWVIDFGPGSGPEGGTIVATGTPTQVAKLSTATALALRQRIAKGSTTARRRRHVAARKGSERTGIASAARAIAAIRNLRGDDVAGGSEADVNDANHDESRPAVVLGQDVLAARRVHEIFDLDLELARVLLDVRRDGLRVAEPEFVRTWRRSGGWLATQPFIEELRDWGSSVPKSAAKLVATRLWSSGLELVDLRGRSTRPSSVDWRALRATAQRFRQAPDSDAAASTLVKEALSLGGGYLELRSNSKTPETCLVTRLADMSRGIVGPGAPSVDHFSRHHRRGKCPGCRGLGAVVSVEERLVIARPNARPGDDAFLTAPAAKILKGILRSELRPLITKLQSEELWQRDAKYSGLPSHQRTLLLHGCWTRPGFGTFLRSVKADPSEVGAWIRWDGLFAETLRALERSNDTGWRDRVVASKTSVVCPFCSGTGYGRHVDLLAIGSEGLATFVERKSVRDLGVALSRLETSSERQRRFVARLRECLDPAIRSAPTLALRAFPEVGVGLRVAKRCTEAFTDMPAVET